MNGYFRHIDRPQPNSPQVALCGCGFEDLARVPISTSLYWRRKKKKKPNASRTRCRDTNYHSHCHGNENLETVNAFQALNLPPLSSQTGCSSRPPTSSTRELGWKMLHQKSSQALSLLPRSRCHPVKCIGVFWACGGFYLGREVFGSFSSSVLYLLVTQKKQKNKSVLKVR